MFKFVFNKESAKGKDKPRRTVGRIDSPEAAEEARRAKDAAEVRAGLELTRVDKLKDLEEPFAIKINGKYVVIHRHDLEDLGLPALDITGRPYVHALKEGLRRSSDYVSSRIPYDQAAADPEVEASLKRFRLRAPYKTADLSKKGLEVFDPTNNAPLPKEIQELRKSVELARATKRLRALTSTATELPEQMTYDKIIRSQANVRDSVLGAMFTDRFQYLPSEAHPNSLCVCGKSLYDEHGILTHGTVADHIASNGKTELHAFQPAYELNGDKSLLRGSSVRYADSPLLDAFVPGVSTEGRYGLVHQSDLSSNDKGSSLYSVRIGANPFVIHRVRNIETTIGPGNIFQKTYQPAEICSRCQNTGLDNTNQRNFDLPCTDHEEGNVSSYGIIYDKDGNAIKVVPNYVGIGNGKVRLINPALARKCAKCDGSKKLQVRSNFSNAVHEIDCPDCNGSGVNLQDFTEQSEHPCPGCNGSLIKRTTSYNVCKKCHGKTQGATYRTPRRTYTEVGTFAGNPLEKTSLSAPSEVRDSTSSIALNPALHGNTSVDGWLNPNPSCLVCHGDKEYQDKRNGMPCNCSIGRADEAEQGRLVAPSHMRFVDKDSLTIPVSIMQMAMAHHYGSDASAWPHSFEGFEDIGRALRRTSFSSEKAPKVLGESYVVRPYKGANVYGDSRNLENFAGVMSPGVNDATGIIQKEMLRRSEARKGSKNYEFRESSAQLNDLADLLVEHLPKLKISTSVPTYDPKRVYDVDPHSAITRKNVDDLHPEVKQVVPDIEDAMNAVVGGNKEGYNSLLDTMYINASRLKQSTEGTSQRSSAMSDYSDARKKLLETIAKNHGSDKAANIDSVLNRLPRVGRV